MTATASHVERYREVIKGKLANEKAAMALDEFLATAKRPYSMLASIEAAAEGMTGKPLGWPRVAAALIDLSASGADYTALRLRIFAEKVPIEANDVATLSREAGRWLAIIHRFDLSGARTFDEASGAFQRAKAAGAFDATRFLEAAVQLSAIYPTSAEFLALDNDADRLVYIRSRLRPECMGVVRDL